MEKNAFLKQYFHVEIVRDEGEQKLVDMYFDLEEGTQREYTENGELIEISGWHAYGWRVKVTGDIEEAYKNFALEHGYSVPAVIVIR